MAGVVIDNLRWRAFIERYDRPGTVFISIHLTGAARTTTAKLYPLEMTPLRWLKF